MDFFWHHKRPHYMHQNISTNYHLCSFLKTSGFTSVSLHATTGLQRRDQRVGLIAGRHGRFQVPAAATLGQRLWGSDAVALFFFFFFRGKEEQVFSVREEGGGGGGWRRRRREGTFCMTIPTSVCRFVLCHIGGCLCGRALSW